MSGAPLFCSSAAQGIRLLKWRAAVAVWVGFIFFSSTNLAEQCAEAVWALVSGQTAVSHPEHGTSYLLLDKGFHVSMFFILALLLCRALPYLRYQDYQVIAAGATIGSCSEYLQSFFPGRDPALRDVLINIGGTVLGLLAYKVFLSRSRSVYSE